MTKLPKSLETVRDELAQERADDSPSPHVSIYDVRAGFDAGVEAVLQSAELKWLAQRLELLVIDGYADHEDRKALERWQKFLGEGSDEE